MVCPCRVVQLETRAIRFGNPLSGDLGACLMIGLPGPGLRSGVSHPQTRRANYNMDGVQHDVLHPARASSLLL